jgi:hypothetical protein
MVLFEALQSFGTVHVVRAELIRNMLVEPQLLVCPFVFTHPLPVLFIVKVI